MKVTFSAVLTLFILTVNVAGQDSLNVELAGTSYHYWNMAWDAVSASGVACVATGGTGLSILDVSDPANIHELSWIPSIGNVVRVVSTENRVYAGFGNGRLSIIDISDPIHSHEIGMVETGGGVPYDIAIEGNYAFLASYEVGLQVVDITDPTNPQVIGHFNTEHFAHSIAVSGSTAYLVTNDDLHVLDVSNPRDPRQIGFFHIGSPIDIVVSRNYAYVMAYHGLYIIDVSDPENPTQAGYFRTSEGGNEVEVVEDRAYLAVDAGLLVLDVSDPANPQEIGQVTARGKMVSVAVDGENALLADYTHGLSVVNISDPANIQELGTYFQVGEVTKMVANGDMLCVLSTRNVRILDAHDPVRPRAISYYGLPNMAVWADVSGNYLFVSEYSETDTGGLRIIDISDPAHPSETGFCGIPGLLATVVVSGNYAFLPGSDILRIVDVSDLENPFQTGQFDVQQEAFFLAIVGNLGYLTDHRHGLHVLNMSDPTRPRYIGFFDSPTHATDFTGVCAADGYVYLAAGDSGLTVVDVSDPEHPREAGHCITPGYVNSITVSGEHAFLSSRAGLRVINISDPTNPFESGYYDRGGNVNHAAIIGNYAFTAEIYNSCIYDVRQALGVERGGSSLIPMEMTLLAPYPNPFNSTVKLSFILPQPGYARLTLDDLSGREVASFAEGQFTAGEHTMVYSASALVSGVYMVRARFGGETRMARVTLLK